MEPDVVKFPANSLLEQPAAPIAGGKCGENRGLPGFGRPPAVASEKNSLLFSLLAGNLSAAGKAVSGLSFPPRAGVICLGAQKLYMRPNPRFDRSPEC
jgi:hypothetical protein